MKVFLNNIQVFVTMWDPGPSVWRTRGVIVFLPSSLCFVCVKLIMCLACIENPKINV